MAGRCARFTDWSRLPSDVRGAGTRPSCRRICVSTSPQPFSSRSFLAGAIGILCSVRSVRNCAAIAARRTGPRSRFMTTHPIASTMVTKRPRRRVVRLDTNRQPDTVSILFEFSHANHGECGHSVQASRRRSVIARDARTETGTARRRFHCA